MRRVPLLSVIAISLALGGCSSDEPSTTTTGADPAIRTAPPSGPTATSDTGSRYAGLSDPIGGIPVESLPIDVGAGGPSTSIPTYDPSAIPPPRYQQPAPPPAGAPINPAANRRVPPPPPPPAWPADRWTTPANR